MEVYDKNRFVKETTKLYCMKVIELLQNDENEFV